MREEVGARRLLIEQLIPSPLLNLQLSHTPESSTRARHDEMKTTRSRTTYRKG